MERTGVCRGVAPRVAMNLRATRGLRQAHASPTSLKEPPRPIGQMQAVGRGTALRPGLQLPSLAHGAPGLPGVLADVSPAVGDGNNAYLSTQSATLGREKPAGPRGFGALAGDCGSCAAGATAAPGVRVVIGLCGGIAFSTSARGPVDSGLGWRVVRPASGPRPSRRGGSEHEKWMAWPVTRFFFFLRLAGPLRRVTVSLG